MNRGLEGRHVAVVGAGVGGLTAAILAARAGARVTLFESAAEPQTVGAGILLQPNGLGVLYGLDLDERLDRDGTRVSTLRVADAEGTALLDVPVPRFADGLDHALVLRRGDLLAALVDLVRAEPAVECRFDTEVVDVSPDGAVASRHAGATDILNADVIVGADGVHSRVRKRSGVPAEVGRTLRYVRGLGPAVASDVAMTEYWTELGIFGVAPLPRGTYFYASTDAQAIESAFHEKDAALFRNAWARALPASADVLRDLDGLDTLVVNQVIRVDCARWTEGRIVLLGDAAHAMAPNLGQGANSALVDAAVLVWELAQEDDRDAAFARYQERRKPAVAAVQDMADRLAWLSDWTNPVLRWARDAAVRTLGSWTTGEVSMRLVEQTDPLWLRIVAQNPRGEIDV